MACRERPGWHGLYCALCGRGCLKRTWQRLQIRLDERESRSAVARASGERWLRMLRRLRIQVCPPYGRVRSLYEIDHVVPVCEGGTSERENLRVLCVPCHKAETRKLMARRAARARIEGVA